MVDRSDNGSQSEANWRDKYLNALDQQEQLEQRLEWLRRVLVRVSVSADGQDEVLDKILAQVRKQLRSNEPGERSVEQLFSQLDQGIVDFERRREDSAQDIHHALQRTLQPLQSADLPRPLKREIAQYLTKLPKRTEKVSLYPALLQQLADLQQAAFQAFEQPRQPGLWQKLFGGEESPAKLHSKPAENSSLSIDANDIEPLTDVEEIRDIADDTPMPVYQLHDNAAAERTVVSADASENAVSKNVARILGDILSKIDSADGVAADAERIRQHLATGLTQETVIPALEHVRDLVIEAYLAANKAFATYLNDMNMELADIYSLLGGAVQSQASRSGAGQSLQESMLQQFAHLETHVAGATELNQLKEQVTSQLGNIRQALDHFQTSEKEQQALTGQLQALAEKIKAMEADAEKNRTTMEKHRYKALHDPLTELPNREAYNERMRAEWQRWNRYGRPLTLAVCDLDHFKKINDNFGHQAGDRVLKVISRSIARRLREVDFFGRYGGEEFVVIMPDTSVENALGVLEKIRAAIASTAFNYKDKPLPITLSMGITDFRAGDSVDGAFARADSALYAAKAQGRNRCVIAE